MHSGPTGFGFASTVGVSSPLLPPCGTSVSFFGPHEAKPSTSTNDGMSERIIAREHTRDRGFPARMLPGSECAIRRGSLAGDQRAVLLVDEPEDVHRLVVERVDARDAAGLLRAVEAHVAPRGHAEHAGRTGLAGLRARTSGLGDLDL